MSCRSCASVPANCGTWPDSWAMKIFPNTTVSLMEKKFASSGGQLLKNRMFVAVCGLAREPRFHPFCAGVASRFHFRLRAAMYRLSFSSSSPSSLRAASRRTPSGALPQCQTSRGIASSVPSMQRLDLFELGSDVYSLVRRMYQINDL